MPDARKSFIEHPDEMFFGHIPDKRVFQPQRTLSLRIHTKCVDASHSANVPVPRLRIGASVPFKQFLAPDPLAIAAVANLKPRGLFVWNASEAAKLRGSGVSSLIQGENDERNCEVVQ